MTTKPLTDRALELASTGQFLRMIDLRAQLEAEDYVDVQFSPRLAQALRALLATARRELGGPPVQLGD